MCWIYRQKSGQLSQPGSHQSYLGYSGHPPHVNDPSAEALKNVGPCPQGSYTIGAPYLSTILGPYVLPLEPDASNEMFGRLGFRIHGDSIKKPGSASDGCLIFARAVRETIWKSGDNRLHVLAD